MAARRVLFVAVVASFLALLPSTSAQIKKYATFDGVSAYSVTGASTSGGQPFLQLPLGGRTDTGLTFSSCIRYLAGEAQGTFQHPVFYYGPNGGSTRGSGSTTVASCSSTDTNNAMYVYVAGSAATDDGQLYISFPAGTTTTTWATGLKIPRSATATWHHICFAYSYEPTFIPSDTTPGPCLNAWVNGRPASGTVSRTSPGGTIQCQNTVTVPVLRAAPTNANTFSRIWLGSATTCSGTTAVTRRGDTAPFSLDDFNLNLWAAASRKEISNAMIAKFMTSLNCRAVTELIDGSPLSSAASQTLLSFDQNFPVTITDTNYNYAIAFDGNVNSQVGECGYAPEQDFNNFSEIAGPDGAKGPVGPTGAKGAPGVAGATGPQGDPGIAAVAGDTGLRGTAGPAGDQGDAGAAGGLGDAGDTGPAGAPGPIGTVGDAGPTGPQGTKGTKGVQGSVGPKGDQGDAGATGIAGNPGATGVAGIQGPVGSQGQQGTQGTKGTRGTDGSTGVAGATGAKGASGDAGNAGATGPQGATGDAGDTIVGSVGPKGAQGQQGAKGQPGPKGVMGDQGPTGAPGPTGAGGNTGPQGAQGPQGATGSKGEKGDVGAGGDSGGPGPTGPRGNKGQQGPSGVTGPQGVQGPPGDTGIAGSPGPQGDPGVTGPRGAQGATGPQGAQGPEGAKGVVGPQGPNGVASTVAGAVGPKGIQGAAGPDGVPGADGTTGPDGRQGNKGLPGDTGDAGATGPTGSTGANGLQGPQGPRGSAGPQGAVGPTGEDGDPGDTGDFGEPGVTGPKGQRGAAGATGPQGDAGIKGIKGAPGSPSVKGASGDAGDTGITGPAGSVGPTGAKGAPGNPGSTGPSGDKGDAGTPGSPGATGPAGQKGQQGAAGAKGVTGGTGPAGIGGDTGTKGSVGPQGDQGIKGDAGATGSVGPKGLPGAPGATGNTGAAGATGPQGDAGTTGAPGLQGPQGIVGSVGPKGNAGPAGDAGPQGAQGPAGGVGPKGVAGPQGAVGVAGPDGPAGPTGVAGATGPKGLKGDVGAPGPSTSTAAFANFMCSSTNSRIIGFENNQPKCGACECGPDGGDDDGDFCFLDIPKDGDFEKCDVTKSWAKRGRVQDYLYDAFDGGNECAAKLYKGASVAQPIASGALAAGNYRLAACARTSGYCRGVIIDNKSGATISEVAWGSKGSTKPTCSCNGNIAAFTLQYAGSSASVRLRVFSGSRVYVDKNVCPGAQVQIRAGSKQTSIDSSLTVSVNGKSIGGLTATCNGLRRGTTVGDFVVKAGRDTNGKPLCSLTSTVPTNCVACSAGKLKSLKFKFLGRTRVSVQAYDGNNLVYNKEVNGGDEFEFSSTGGAFSGNVKLQVQWQTDAIIDASTCGSEWLGPSSVHGRFLLTKASLNTGKDVCPYDIANDGDGDEDVNGALECKASSAFTAKDKYSYTLRILAEEGTCTVDNVCVAATDNVTPQAMHLAAGVDLEASIASGSSSAFVGIIVGVSVGLALTIVAAVIVIRHVRRRRAADVLPTTTTTTTA